MKARLHLKIYGRVQGIGFRFSAARKAKELGLTGWVRNCDDGCVETEVDGEEGAVDKYRAWCKKGTISAKVARVEEEWRFAISNHQETNTKQTTTFNNKTFEIW